ncbi:hypothetical protein EX30DRAFT_13220 [Ascodesmis nigricans]|uniref:Eukaryotic translation initiation factor 3 subunit A n=1 Tax=Ascodesmis nigricans TaxID=341454 RepID=A0A4S2N6I6_9PEZI|nr:hypothetical protein EX30DRAFT_13220 [Ascodesmis nigricans]
MPPPPHAKPENVLKRAQELVAVNKNLSALELLHDHVTAKRTRNSPIPALEPVMIMFVELCVSLRKGKTAKDGLYQYKNIAQNTSVPTIELVLKKFIELAENKVTEAQERAEQIIKLDQIDDLEASETPESVLLSTVSGEQSKDRTDRAVVTPWLKFLWETYRTVLDILRNNARLEIMYQTTAFQAFKFCQKYTRKTEFRRLCELLRNHVQNAAKYANTMHAINLNDPDTLQRHLDTRFQQLNVAVELELWQEAFRSVEDIHTLLTLSKKQAKNVMMANYYEQLTEIFMRSENYLFHAAAFSRLYNLLLASAAQVAQNPALKKDSPDASKEERVRVASLFLLSALSIPVISQARSRGTLLDVDEAKRTKNTRLTNLLGMSRAPTRAALFKDIINKGILKIARPEIRELYTILEVDFHPLSICKKISPILEKIAADEKLQRYVHPLQQVILTRLFQQLSQVYDSVQLKFVLDLATFPSPFEVTPSIIEKFIMNGCKKGDLSIRIDHAAGVLTFESDIFSSTKPLHPGSGAGSAEKGSIQKLQSTPSEIVRTQMSRLAKACYITLTHVDPEFVAERQVAKEAAQQRALKGAAKEHKDTLARRTIIERKKEAAESALIKKEKEEAAIRAQKQEEARAAEAARVAEAQRLRDQARIKAEQDRIRKEEIKKQLEDLALKNKVDLDKIDDLDSNAIRRMKLEQLEKEKKDMSEKLRITGKRIDHLERAYRREEVKLLPQDYERQRAQDLAAYEEEKKLTLETAKTQHEEAVALKHRLGRLVGSYESFRDRIKEERAAIFEANRKRAEKELEKAKEKRRQEVRAAREAELRAQEEEERRRREEEERIAREEQEKKEREERVREEMKNAASPQSEERRPTPSAGGAYRLPAKRTEGTASPGTSTPRHNNGPYRRRDNGQEGGSPAPQEGEKPQGNKYIPPSQRQGGWRK